MWTKPLVPSVSAKPLIIIGSTELTVIPPGHLRLDRYPLAHIFLGHIPPESWTDNINIIVLLGHPKVGGGGGIRPSGFVS